MGKEKLKNQKIEEKDLANVAGGNDLKMDSKNSNNAKSSKTQGEIFVSDEELEMLKKLDVLNKDGKIDNAENLLRAGLALSFKPDDPDESRYTKDRTHEIIID